MVRAGEAVGDIYVRAHVDGRGMDRELARNIEKFDAEEHGAEVGKDWAKGYQRTIAQRVPKSQRREFRKIISESAIQGAKTGEIFKSRMFGEIEKDIRTAYTQPIAERMIGSLKKSIEREGLGLGAFIDTEDDEGNIHEARVKTLLRDLHIQWAQFRDDEAKQNAAWARKNVLTQGKIEKFFYDQKKKREEERTKQTEKNFDDLIDLSERASKTIERIEQAQHQSSIDRMKRLRAQERADFDATVQRLEGEGRLRAQKARQREQQTKNFIASFDRLIAATKRMQSGESGFGENLTESVKRTREHVEELRREMDGLDFDSTKVRGYARALNDMDDTLFRINPRLRRFHRNTDRFTSILGRSFGRGSRNDFVHFFGVLTEGMARVALLPTKLISPLLNLGKAFGTFFTTAGSFGTRLGAVFGRLAPMLLSSLGGIAALGAGMLLLVPILGLVASLVSGLVAALTALVGTISLAVIGGLAALVGVLGAVGIGVGVLTAGILSLSDTQKKALKTAIKPFTEGMKEIGRVAASTIFGGERFERTIKNMSKALTSGQMKKLVEQVADAIGDVSDSWAKALNSSGFRKWLKSISKTVPDQIRTMGKISENFGETFGNVFVAMQPMINRFLDWLERVSESWAELSGSAEGQNSLRDFFQRAGDAGRSVVGLLGSVKDALGALFSAGNEAGIGIIDSLSNKVQELGDYIKKNPESVGDWFEHGKETIEDVGRFLLRILDIFKELDTEASRQRLSSMFDALNTVLEFTAGFVRGLQASFEELWRVVRVGAAAVAATIGYSFGTVAFVIGGLLDGVGAVAGALGYLPGVPDDWGKGIDKASDKMYEFGQQLYDLDNNIWPKDDLVLGVDARQAVDAVALIDRSLLPAIGTVGTAIRGLPPVTPVRVTDLGTAAKTNQLFKQLGAVIENDIPALSKTKVTDDGTNKNLQELLFGTKGSLDDLPKNTITRVSDGSTARPLRVLLSPIKDLLKDIDGTHKSKVEGKITPSNWKKSLDSLASRIRSLVGTRTVNTVVRTGQVAESMAGSIFTSPGISTFAEDGKAEAIVPLERPLALVDPAVRDIAAFAQGKYKGEGTGGGRVVDASGWTVVSNSEDSRTVATEVLNEIVGKLL